MGWLKGGLPPYEGYLERAGMHLRARAYLQAAEDGQSAVDATDALLQVRTQPNSTELLIYQTHANQYKKVIYTIISQGV